MIHGLMYAQDTTSTVFAPIGAVWHYTPYEDLEPTVGYLKFKVIKDTFLLGYEARQVARFIYNYNIEEFERQHDLDQYVSTIGAKVYYKVEDQFYLLYDFGASPGDTIHSRVADFPVFMGCFSQFENGPLDFSYIVDSTIVVQIDGQALRRQFVSPLDNVTGQNWTFWEGITDRIAYARSGGYWWGQGAGCLLSDAYGFLRCYTDNTIVFHPPNVPYDCTFTNVNELKDTDLVKIYPNPASDYMVLPKESAHVRVYDMMGKMMPVAFEEHSLDVSGLRSGMYVCVFESGGEMYRSMFVKAY